MNMSLVLREENIGAYRTEQGIELQEYDSAAVLHLNYILGGKKIPFFFMPPCHIS